ncbi:hypothetical protein L1049_022359 [Liquidambar formosana]|uniref:Uncharacterized protein n=1 Tax=Liquidambar formosana TaxID=63359 RepID=A0AAP0RCC0_LIQFO
MVLWEITLGTAYFLGLKRTYKLTLKIQRRLISPKNTKQTFNSASVLKQESSNKGADSVILSENLLRTVVFS